MIGSRLQPRRGGKGAWHGVVWFGERLSPCPPPSLPSPASGEGWGGGGGRASLCPPYAKFPLIEIGLRNDRFTSASVRGPRAAHRTRPLRRRRSNRGTASRRLCPQPASPCPDPRRPRCCGAGAAGHL